MREPGIFRWEDLRPVLQKIKRRITPSSWVSDLIALEKSLLLCSLHSRQVDPGRFGYRELTHFHAEGRCDQCQEEGPGALWLYEPSYDALGYRSRDQMKAVQARERAMGQRWW